MALLRAFSGAYDQDFTFARLHEIQALLDSAEELGDGVAARPITTREGYARWAPSYDEPGNELLEIEQPVVREVLASLPVGVALDAACGTGRHTVYLASLGHSVIGVDSSPEMLALAREKVPEGEFHVAGPARRASRRRLRRSCRLRDRAVSRGRPRAGTGGVRSCPSTDGHLVISDSRGLIGDIGLPLLRVGPEGEVGYMPIYARLASDYLAAALPLGLRLRRCEEPRRPSPMVGEDGTDLYDGVRPPDHVPGEPPNIWSFHALAAAATNAAWEGKPAAIIWHFQLSAD